MDTIFNKKKILEFANVKKVYGFIKNQMGISYQGIKRYEYLSKVDSTELQQIIRFKELYNKKLKAFQTAFFLSKHKWGRIIPANDYLSLSIFHRPTRHSLCQGIYRDIDMVNAAPTTIYEIAKLNNRQCKWLGKYVNRTKKYREFIMEHHNCSKDCAKNLPIVLMMGGSYKGWIEEWDIQQNIENHQKIKDIIELENELKDIMDIVYASNRHIEKDVLKVDPTKWRNLDERKRGVMSLWCQSIERLFQETAISFLVQCKDFKIEHIVPCQDGFMILKELWYDDILQDCQRVISEKFGINMKFVDKPFDEAIPIEEYEDDKDVNEWEDNISSKKLADKFLELFGNYVIKYQSNIYVFYGHKWFDESDSKKQHKLTRYISENLYEKMKNEIEGDSSLVEKDRNRLLKILRINTSSGNKINDIVKHILSKAKENTKDEFNVNPFLLGFDNGVYDLQKDEFRPYKFDDFMTQSTRYDYMKPNYEDINTQEIKRELIEIFETIQPNKEARKLFMQVLASGLDGMAYQKLFLFNGQGGNGKGLTGSLMDVCLGDYYHQPSNGILKSVEQCNAPSPDMINLKNKRYINFKEVSGLIKVAMLRNLTGGGKFSGRYLNKNPESFSMSATFLMEFNVSPDLDGKPQPADYRRMVHIEFPINFTDDENKINKVIGGTLYKQANSKYGTQEFLQSVKYVFLDMLLDEYKENLKDRDENDKLKGILFTIPEQIRIRTEKFIENQNIFHKLFNDLWETVEIPKDEEDKKKYKEEKKKYTVKVKDIWTSITQTDDYRSLNYRDKRNYSRDEFEKWIVCIHKVKVNSKKAKVIIGLQRRYKSQYLGDTIDEDGDEDEDEDEDEDDEE